MLGLFSSCLYSNERDTIDLELPESIQHRHRQSGYKEGAKKGHRKGSSINSTTPIPAGTKQFMQSEINEIRQSLDQTQLDLKLVIKAYLESFTDTHPTHPCFNSEVK